MICFAYPALSFSILWRFMPVLPLWTVFSILLTAFTLIGIFTALDAISMAGLFLLPFALIAIGYGIFEAIIVYILSGLVVASVTVFFVVQTDLMDAFAAGLRQTAPRDHFLRGSVRRSPSWA